MTQTIERELRLKFEAILIPALSDNPQTQEAVDYAKELAKRLAVATKEVAGIAKAEKKFQDPYWDLLHGKTPDEQAAQEAENRARINTDIAARLETGLRRGEFPQGNDAQSVYLWIAEREKKGQSLDRFITWAMEGKRAEFSFIYHKDPRLIKRDWAQVFLNDNVEFAQPDKDGGFR